MTEALRATGVDSTWKTPLPDFYCERCDEVRVGDPVAHYMRHHDEELMRAVLNDRIMAMIEHKPTHKP